MSTERMRLTMDIRISGCATRCWHCYVNGGPGPFMSLEEYRDCLDALGIVVGRLEQYGFEINLYLDYEPLLHPDICEILRITHERFHDYFRISTIPTTGIPIAIRSDWEDVLETLQAVGIKQLELTLHGTEQIQNKATSHSGAFELQSTAIRRARAYGFDIALNLMVTKDMLQQFEETMEIVHCIDPNSKRAVIPAYEPIPRLRRFEEHRADLEDIEPFREDLAYLCDESKEKEYWRTVDKYAEQNVLSDVLTHPEDYPSFASLEAKMPSWVFVTVVPGLDMYYGNVGLYHRKLGVLSAKSSEHLAEHIRPLKPNYQFGGFYNVQSLPAPVDVARRSGDPGSGKLYNTVEAVFFRWLDLIARAKTIKLDPKV